MIAPCAMIIESLKNLRGPRIPCPVSSKRIRIQNIDEIEYSNHFEIGEVIF